MSYFTVNEKKHDYIAENQPYEKFVHQGPEALTDSELLAIILRTGTREKNALALASEVLSMGRYPREGLLGLFDISWRDLQRIRGIGQVKAIKLKCIVELSRRISLATAVSGFEVHSPATVAEYFMESLRHRKTECVVLVSLDGKGQLIGEHEISNGSVNMSLLSPREIFVRALKDEAVGILLVHNHPSGNPTPSSADVQLTKAIFELGRNLEIPLVDHIVIGDNRYVSFQEQHLI